jgi:hypothetical protein
MKVHVPPADVDFRGGRIIKLSLWESGGLSR